MRAKFIPDRLLLVDDSPDTLEVLARNLSGRGFEVHTTLSARAAMKFLAAHDMDLLITDVKMPGMSGMDLLRLVRGEHPALPVMMITGYATIEGAVEAVKEGAEEYLAKPFTGDELLAAVDRALGKGRTRRALTARTPPQRLGLLGGSEGMRRAFDAMERAAASGAPALLLGEPGTGRESAARAVHQASPRAGQIFLPLNCETIPPGQLAGEVLRALALARGGSLYLRAVERLGAEAFGPVLEAAGGGGGAARILASAGPDFSSLIDRSLLPRHLASLREWETIALPPLRERGSDVLILAEHWASQEAQSLGRPSPTLSDALRQALRAYPWPGNVGELRTVLSKAVRECTSDALDVQDAAPPLRFVGPHGSGPLKPLAAVEADYIREVLAGVDGNKSRAAEILGIDRKTLREKLK